MSIGLVDTQAISEMTRLIDDQLVIILENSEFNTELEMP